MQGLSAAFRLKLLALAFQAAQQAAFDAMGPDADRFFAAWAEMEQTEAAYDAAEPEPEAGG